jgi:hypothetical protein
VRLPAALTVQGQGLPLSNSTGRVALLPIGSVVPSWQGLKRFGELAFGLSSLIGLRRE